MFLVTIALFTSSTLTTKAVVVAVPISAEPDFHVERLVKIESGGIIFMDDTYMIEHPVEIAELWVGFDSSYVSERTSFEVWYEGEWTPLDYEASVKNDYSGYNLTFPSAVSSGENLKFRASFLFLELVTQRSNKFNARLPLYPTLTYNVSSYILSVRLPLDAVFDEVTTSQNFTTEIRDYYEFVEYETVDVQRLQNEDATVSYVPSPDDKYLIDCGMLERGLRIKQSTLRVEDTFELRNLGSRMTKFTLSLQEGASSIITKDGVGPLTVTEKAMAENATSVDVVVTPRYTVRTGDIWRFTISYTLPRGDYITKLGGDTNLAYRLQGFPHYVHELSAKVYLPDGGRYLSSEPAADSVGKEGSLTTVSFVFGAQLPYGSPVVTMALRESPLTYYMRLLAVLVVAIAVVGSAYVLRRRRGADVEVPVIVAEKPQLSGFLEQYVERVSLLKEMEELARRLDDSEIGREEFDGRSAEVKRRQGELIRVLRRMRGELEAEYPDLVEGLREVRKAEEELEKVEGDLRNLEVRLRARRVSRRDYQRRRQDRLTRRSQAIEHIEGALASLTSV